MHIISIIHDMRTFSVRKCISYMIFTLKCTVNYGKPLKRSRHFLLSIDIMVYRHSILICTCLYGIPCMDPTCKGVKSTEVYVFPISSAVSASACHSLNPGSKPIVPFWYDIVFFLVFCFLFQYKKHADYFRYFLI